jgi:plasmid maintenance system antidote protein VapI
VDKSKDLRALAKKYAAPEHLTATGRRLRFGETADVDTGQIWRARWDEVTCLVAVLDVEPEVGTEILVAPMSVEPTGADENSLVVDGNLTGWGVPVTVWVGLAARIPLRTFVEPVDELPKPVRAYAHALADRGELGTAPVGVRVGRRETDPFDVSLTVRADLEDRLTALAHAPALPTSDMPTAGDLRQLGLKVLQVQQLLDITLSQAVDVLGGKAALTSEQVDKLADAAGADTEALLALVRPIPTSLARELDSPRWKRLITTCAKQWNVDELTARSISARGTYALAARGAGVVPDWGSRLRRYFEAHVAGDPR